MLHLFIWDDFIFAFCNFWLSFHRKQVNQTYELPLELDQEFLSRLQWFTYSRITERVPLQNPEPDQFFFTDASLTGWGASWKDFHISGSFTTERQGFHINWLEMEAVRLAVLHWGSQWQGQTLRLYSDNSTTVAYIRRQGSTIFRDSVHQNSGTVKPTGSSLH